MDQETSKKRELQAPTGEERLSKIQKNEGVTVVAAEMAPEEPIQESGNTSRVPEYLYGLEDKMRTEKLVFNEWMQMDGSVSSHRAAVVDFVADLTVRLDLDSDTLHAALSYFDRYNSLNPVCDPAKWDLMGASSLFIAAKYEHVDAKDTWDYVQHMDKPIVEEQILDMETDMLGVLSFEFGYPTIKTFLRKFMDAIQKDYEERKFQLEHLACYIADLSLMEHECFKFKPSLLASSIIFLIRFLIQPNLQPWNSMLEQQFSYKASDLKECVNILYELHLGKRHSTLEVIREKYKQDQLYWRFKDTDVSGIVCHVANVDRRM